MDCTVIIPAAGKGTRMGMGKRKQYILLNGIPVLARTIEPFQQCSLIKEIIVITSKDEIEYCKDEIIEKYNYSKVSAIVQGGDHRQDSVYNGIQAISSNTNIVLVHDGARPLIEECEIVKSIEAAVRYGGACVGVKVKDTIKEADKENLIINTPNREKLWMIQTPQTFQHKIIREAYEKAKREKFYGTDEAMLVEKYKLSQIKIIEGSYQNIKITTKEDLIMAESVLQDFKKNK